MQISLQFDEFFDRKNFKILILRRYEILTKTSHLKLVGTHCILTWPQIYFRPFRLSLSFNPLSAKCECWCLYFVWRDFEILILQLTNCSVFFHFIRALLQNRSILLWWFLFWVNAPVTNIVLGLNSHSQVLNIRSRKKRKHSRIRIENWNQIQEYLWHPIISVLILTIGRRKQSKLA